MMSASPLKPCGGAPTTACNGGGGTTKLTSGRGSIVKPAGNCNGSGKTPARKNLGEKTTTVRVIKKGPDRGLCIPANCIGPRSKRARKPPQKYGFEQVVVNTESANQNLCDGGKMEACNSGKSKTCDGGKAKACNGAKSKACGSGKAKACDGSKAMACDGGKAEVCDGGKTKVCDGGEKATPCDSSKKTQTCGGEKAPSCGGNGKVKDKKAKTDCSGNGIKEKDGARKADCRPSCG